MECLTQRDDSFCLDRRRVCRISLVKTLTKRVVVWPWQGGSISIISNKHFKLNIPPLGEPPCETMNLRECRVFSSTLRCAVEFLQSQADETLTINKHECIRGIENSSMTRIFSSLPFCKYYARFFFGKTMNPDFCTEFLFLGSSRPPATRHQLLNPFQHSFLKVLTHVPPRQLKKTFWALKQHYTRQNGRWNWEQDRRARLVRSRWATFSRTFITMKIYYKNLGPKMR